MRYRAVFRIRAFIRHVFLLILLTKIYHINASSTTSSDESLDDAQRSNIHQVVGNTVDVHAGGVERRGGRWWSGVGMGRKSTGRSRSAPRYISRLYERYMRGDVVHGADTVRSINAELGSRK